MRVLWRGIHKVVEEATELATEGARLNAFPQACVQPWTAEDSAKWEQNLAALQAETPPA